MPCPAPPANFQIPANPSDNFTYATKESPGGQRSGLSLGTAAGVGKLFQFGGRIVGGFANATVFNFLGKNPKQPSVQSFLPLSFAQPFLRGGGRAVTLETLTHAERNLVYAARNLARFRQEFVPYVFGIGQAVDVEGTNDPNIGYLNVILQLQDVENDRPTLEAYQAYLDKFQKFVGGGSGISQLQVDQIDQGLQNTLSRLITDEIQYRTVLDQYKFQIGMPPDVPMILDRNILSGFRRAFERIQTWTKLPDADRDNADLAKFVDAMPKLPDFVIDGRPIVEYWAKPELREDILLAGERVAMENRLDLMNQKATLYDNWRQLTVTANALKGVLTVGFTNQFITPSTTNNPAAFIDQSKTFQMTLNSELPLIRMTERNAYRTAVINYERQRRSLMSFEDNLKFTIRNEIRTLIQNGQQYEIQKRLLLLTLRQKDNSQRQINAPPGSGGADTSAQVASNTLSLVNAQNSILTAQTALVTTWANYTTARLVLARDLGTIPYDEWEAFYEFFPPDSTADREPAPAVGPRRAPAAAPVAGPAAGVNLPAAAPAGR